VPPNLQVDFKRTLALQLSAPTFVSKRSYAPQQSAGLSVLYQPGVEIHYRAISADESVQVNDEPTRNRGSAALAVP